MTSEALGGDVNFGKRAARRGSPWPMLEAEVIGDC